MWSGPTKTTNCTVTRWASPLSDIMSDTLEGGRGDDFLFGGGGADICAAATMTILWKGAPAAMCSTEEI